MQQKICDQSTMYEVHDLKSKKKLISLKLVSKNRLFQIFDSFTFRNVFLKFFLKLITLTIRGGLTYCKYIDGSRGVCS